MAAGRSLLSGLVLSAVVLTGLGAPAGSAQTPAAAQPVRGPAALTPATASPLNLAVPASIPFVDNLPPAAGANGHLSGSRSAAGMVGRNLTDTVRIAWNPTTGNVLLTGKLLHLEGADRDIDLSWRYNSINDHRPTISAGKIESAVVVGADNSVTYTATDGGTYKFVPKTGGGWTMPPGLNATIMSLTASGVILRFNDSGHTNEYQKVGGVFRLAFAGDRYSNSTDRIAYAYDSYGRLETITTASGRQVLFEYNDTSNTGQPSTITDQTLNRVITIAYDNNGRMESLTEAAGAALGFSYASGRLQTFTDGRGTDTELSYDGNGKAAEILYAAGTANYTSHTTSSYNSTTSYLTDTDNRQTMFNFNAARQITSITDPLGNVTTETFNTHDDRLTTLDDLGNLTTATYNANNTLANILSPVGGATGTGKQVSYTYPAPTTGEAWLEFQPATSTDSEGNVTSYTYDPSVERLSHIITPGGALGGGTTERRYQGDIAITSCGGVNGQLCKTIDGKGNTTSITYNASRNPVTITRPAPLGVITNTFDAAGRIATSQDGKGQTATYVYDNNDRLLQTRFGGTCVAATCVTYTYDENGNLETRVDASGTTTNVYDEQNRPTSKAIGGVTTSLTYDPASNVTSSTDPLGTANYRYDDADRLVALAEPGGSCPGTPAFPNSTKCTGFVYDDNNRRTETKYPNGVKNATVYDKAGRVTSITATNTSAAVLASRTYTYTTHPTTGRDGALRKTMKTEANVTTTYSYDAVQRLTQAVTGAVTEGWTYDLNGNRLTDTKTGAATVHYAYNAADQLCWVGSTAAACASPPSGATMYGYDANGNTTLAGTTTQSYNTFDQFTANTNGGTTNYTYTGTRNDERLTAGATAFLNGSLGVTRQTTSGASTSFIRDPQGTLISMRNSAGASFYYTTDALGSTILLTDSTQAAAATYAYDSWGLATVATGTQAAVNPWTYAGGYNDTTSNRIKFGARYYNPFRGRFTQPDPSGQESNRYAYARSNPCNFTDRTGLLTFDQGLCIASFIGHVGATISLIAAPFTSGLSTLAAAGFYALSLVGTARTCETA